MSRFGSDARLRGRAGQEQRARRLKLYPFCAHCEAVGIQRLTAIIDHIKPLAFGGLDEDENCQGLCAVHDAIKTSGEQASQQAASNHPAWLEPSLSPVRIVTGPPCGGKTTFVTQCAKPTDMVIDLDAIAATLQPGWDRRWNGDLLNRSIRIRNSMLGSLSRVQVSCCWFIVSAPTLDERIWWQQKLGPLSVVSTIDPGEPVVIDRAVQRDGRIDHVAAWYRARSLPWSPDRVKQAAKVPVDADGYPVP